MNWQKFLVDHEKDFGSRYERLFVELVLARTPGLNPSSVRCQTPFRDRDGRPRRMDFSIEEEGVRIAIEIDGWDKTGTGTGMSRKAFDEWTRRENALKNQGWDVLRFANTSVKHRPDECREVIETQLGLARSRRRSAAAERPASSFPNPGTRPPPHAMQVPRPSSTSRPPPVRQSGLSYPPIQSTPASGGEERLRALALAAMMVIVPLLFIAWEGGGGWTGASPARSGTPAADARYPSSTIPPRSDAAAPLPDPDFCPDPVAWGDVSHLGKEVLVHGRVVGVRFGSGMRGQPTFLNVGYPFPDPRRLTVVIWGRNRQAFSQPPEQLFHLREVCIRGILTDYEGSPQIEVASPEAIKAR